jgi:hypothetical protein
MAANLILSEACTVSLEILERVLGFAEQVSDHFLKVFTSKSSTQGKLMGELTFFSYIFFIFWAINLHCRICAFLRRHGLGHWGRNKWQLFFGQQDPALISPISVCAQLRLAQSKSM